MDATDKRYEIRAAIARNRVLNYEVAMAMNISNSAFYQKLQRPVFGEAAQEFFDAIEKVANEKHGHYRG